MKWLRYVVLNKKNKINLFTNIQFKWTLVYKHCSEKKCTCLANWNKEKNETCMEINAIFTIKMERQNNGKTNNKSKSFNLTTGVSRYHEGSDKNTPWNPLVHHINMVTSGIRGVGMRFHLLRVDQRKKNTSQTKSGS